MTPLELDQLVREIGDEVWRRLGATGGAPAGAVACACGTASDPQASQGRTSAGNGHEPGAIWQPAQGSVAGLINHSLLRPDAGEDDIRQLCGEARRYGFASVCVQPARVARSVRELKGSAIRVCAVIGFPHGATLTPVKLAEVEQVLKLGARELELVVHPGALKSGDLDGVYTEIRCVVEYARRAGAAVKVIAEMALLSEQEKVTACALARLGGAQGVKTSADVAGQTGSTGDVALAQRVVGGDLAIEAAGGIDCYSRLLEAIAAGATRVGTASGVAIVGEAANG